MKIGKKRTRKLYRIFVVFNLLLIMLVVGYCLYSDRQDAIAYDRCIKQQSLDVTKQEAISDYCYDAAQRGGYRE